MSKQEMLINYVPGEECRIAIVKDNRLEELYQERASAESHVGNMYKGKVVNVEPSIQAAFIEFGLERNGFLHISDLHPMYFPGEAKEQTERIGKKTPRRDRPPIQRCLRRGQEILVQVLKEGIGTKGPTLTSYLSIPGRFLVMMPHMERLGVSRKIDDDETRRATRQLLDELNPPDGFGFIVRTAGNGRPKTELKRDLAFLQRLWKAIDSRMQETQIGELYIESDLVIRTIRDVFSSDINRIVVDNEAAARRARDFLRIVNPRSSSNVAFYDDPIPLFHRYKLEEQLENINARTVPLPSGGTLVIDQTEALVAIDVNSGKMRENRDAETTAYRTNFEAADEICRQLRLRDLGGVIVNDLIDMHQANRRRDIEQRFRENLRRDRARSRILSISQLGILEMTRQRMRPSLSRSIHIDCHHCDGSGRVKSPESVVLNVMRRLALLLSQSSVAKAELTVSPDVAFELLNRKRTQLVELERRCNKPVVVRVDPNESLDFVRLIGLDERGGEVDIPDLLPKDKDLPLVPIADTSPQEEDVATGERDESKTERPSAPGKRRRRRRSGTSPQPDATAATVKQTKPKSEIEESAASAPREKAAASPADEQTAQAKSAPQPKRRTRRGRGRRGSSHGKTAAGDANVGDANVGDANAGDTNAGDTNAGDTNAGDTNKSRSSVANSGSASARMEQVSRGYHNQRTKKAKTT